MIMKFLEWGAANQTAYIFALSAIGLAAGAALVYVKRAIFGK